jgi:hypothetical protein
MDGVVLAAEGNVRDVGLIDAGRMPGERNGFGAEVHDHIHLIDGLRLGVADPGICQLAVADSLMTDGSAASAQRSAAANAKTIITVTLTMLVIFQTLRQPTWFAR